MDISSIEKKLKKIRARLVDQKKIVESARKNKNQSGRQEFVIIDSIKIFAGLFLFCLLIFGCIRFLFNDILFIEYVIKQTALGHYNQVKLPSDEILTASLLKNADPHIYPSNIQIERDAEEENVYHYNCEITPASSAAISLLINGYIEPKYHEIEPVKIEGTLRIDKNFVNKAILIDEENTLFYLMYHLSFLKDSDFSDGKRPALTDDLDIAFLKYIGVVSSYYADVLDEDYQDVLLKTMENGTSIMSSAADSDAVPVYSGEAAELKKIVRGSVEVTNLTPQYEGYNLTAAKISLIAASVMLVGVLIRFVFLRRRKNISSQLHAIWYEEKKKTEAIDAELRIEREKIVQFKEEENAKLEEVRKEEKRVELLLKQEKETRAEEIRKEQERLEKIREQEEYEELLNELQTMSSSMKEDMAFLQKIYSEKIKASDAESKRKIYEVFQDNLNYFNHSPKINRAYKGIEIKPEDFAKIAEFAGLSEHEFSSLLQRKYPQQPILNTLIALTLNPVDQPDILSYLRGVIKINSDFKNDDGSVDKVREIRLGWAMCAYARCITQGLKPEFTFRKNEFEKVVDEYSQVQKQLRQKHANFAEMFEAYKKCKPRKLKSNDVRNGKKIDGISDYYPEFAEWQLKECEEYKKLYKAYENDSFIPPGIRFNLDTFRLLPMEKVPELSFNHFLESKLSEKRYEIEEIGARLEGGLVRMCMEADEDVFMDLCVFLINTSGSSRYSSFMLQSLVVGLLPFMLANKDHKNLEIQFENLVAMRSRLINWDKELSFFEVRVGKDCSIAAYRSVLKEILYCANPSLCYADVGKTIDILQEEMPHILDLLIKYPLRLIDVSNKSTDGFYRFDPFKHLLVTQYQPPHNQGPVEARYHKIVDLTLPNSVGINLRLFMDHYSTIPVLFHEYCHYLGNRNEAEVFMMTQHFSEYFYNKYVEAAETLLNNYSYIHLKKMFTGKSGVEQVEALNALIKKCYGQEMPLTAAKTQASVMVSMTNKKIAQDNAGLIWHPEVPYPMLHSQQDHEKAGLTIYNAMIRFLSAKKHIDSGEYKCFEEEWVRVKNGAQDYLEEELFWDDLKINLPG